MVCLKRCLIVRFHKGLNLRNYNKMFREWQHPQVALIGEHKISQCWPSASWYSVSPNPMSGQYLKSIKTWMVILCLRPGPSLSWKISKFCGMRNNWPSTDISNRDLLHGTVHYSIKFQANNWVLYGMVTSSLRPGHSQSWKISKFHRICENWPNRIILNIQSDSWCWASFHLISGWYLKSLDD